MSLQNFNVETVNNKMGELLTAFDTHPDKSNPTIFFLYDFIRNTRAQLQQISQEQIQSDDQGAREKAQEVIGRNSFANTLVSDRSGKLALLTGGDPSSPVDFGDEIRAKAKAVAEE